MDRREYLAVVGAIGLGGLAGCTEETGDGAEGGQNTTNAPDTEEPTTQATDTGEPSTEEPTTEQPSSAESSYAVRIQYSGEWSGSVGGDGSVRSVDGSGTETFDIEGDSLIVSANAQKQDDSSDTLTVQILEESEVIAERSTSAEYGVAQVTSEDGMGGGSDNSTSDNSNSEASFSVRIQYSGEWTGSIGGDGSVRSVEGSGTETFEVDGDPLIVSANAQKQDDSSDTLTVQILQDGELIAEQSTSAEYGVAQVTSEDDVSGGGSDDSEDDSESEASFSVRIQYSGDWQGNIGTGGSTRTVEGSDSRTIDIEGSPDVISANAQKEDDSSDELTIQILEDGEVVEEESTSAAYGLAQVTYSNF